MGSSGKLVTPDGWITTLVKIFDGHPHDQEDLHMQYPQYSMLVSTHLWVLLLPSWPGVAQAWLIIEAGMVCIRTHLGQLTRPDEV
jgi:hypothetical protein